MLRSRFEESARCQRPSCQGVEQNLAAAAELYKAAAAQGSEQSQLGLGNLYERGIGVPQNLALAAAFYREAADQGRAWQVAAMA